MNLNDSTEGRWTSPDLLGGDITNPQSLNRYAYALNNPATLTDPTGLDSCWNHGSYEGSGSPPPCSYGAPVSYTLDGVDVPGSVVAGALQGGFALPSALAGTNAQLVSSPGSSAFEYANALQIGTETTATTDLSGNVMGISYSPIYSNGVLNFSLPSIQFTTIGPQASTSWLQTKVFVSTLGNNFISEFKQGGCFAQFANELAGTGGSPPGVAPEDMIRTVGQAGAMSYAMAKGLSYPLKSSIYRGMLGLTETAAGIVTLAPLDYEEGKAFIHEMQSLGAGTCQ